MDKKKGIIALFFCLWLTGCRANDTVPIDVPPGYTAYQLTYDFSLCSNASVGNDWENAVVFAGNAVASGEYITVRDGEHIVLQVTVCERDRYPDRASEELSIPSVGGAATCRLIVRENHGRYTDNCAIWECTCTAEIV